jgi:sigma-B regulation protein RsbQ
MSTQKRNNVQICGDGPSTMMLAHGFGCDQNMWRLMQPAFVGRYRIVRFDLVGSGNSDLTAYDPRKYDSLHGYAADVVEIATEFARGPTIFVGHSVSAMIGMLADLSAPGLFAAHAMVGPSPCYINDGDYVGGFKQEDIEGLLDFLDSNHLGWSSTMAPVIMGNPERPDLGEELTNSFCRTNPEIAKHFARVTFLSDNRADLRNLRTKALILQCSQDAIAPDVVGRYMHQNLQGSEFVQLKATGHCPNLSAPEETIAAMEAFLRDPGPVRTAAE